MSHPADPSRSPASALAAELLFDAFAEAAALVGPDGAVIQVNGAFQSRFGPAPWAGRNLDVLLVDPLDAHVAPWRRTAATGRSARLRLRLADWREMTAEVRVRRAGEAMFLATLAPAALLTEEAAAPADFRLELALAAGGLSAWRHDLDTGEGWVEGPLAARYPAPHGFGPAGWRGRVHADDLAALKAAFLAMEFGGRLDQRFRMQGEDGRWRTHHASGAREPDFGREARRAWGVLREVSSPAARARADPAEAAASAQMSAWTFDVPSRRFRVTGAVLDRLGLAGPVCEMDLLEWRARVPDDDRGQMDRATRELQQDGSTEVDYRVRTEDGELVWLSLRGGVSEQDAAGAVLRYSGFLSEIGVRKQLEQKLAERERQLSEAVEAGLIGIWTLDMQTAYMTVQGKLAGWMGADPSGAVTPEAWRAVLHEQDFDRGRAAFRDITRGEDFAAFDYRLRSPEGWRWARTAGRIVERDPAGRPLRAAGVVIDISAERALARALSAEKRRFETVYQDTPALMHTLDTHGRTVMVSDYWVTRMGYGRDEAMGAPACAFFAPPDDARLRDEIIPRSLASGVIENESLTCRTKEGALLEVRVSAFWERDERGRPVRAHAVYAEVGDLSRAQRELETRNEELERVNRELNRFTTIASHDLQEPLRKISAFASLLRRRHLGSFDADADRSLEYLVDAAGRMRSLIDDLLAYTRASSHAVAPETVNPAALWREVTEGQDLQIAEAEAVIDTGDLPAVRGDAVLIRLLLSNLLSNALKFRKGPGVRISLRGFVQRGEACLTFADDGIGFDPRFSAKVFEPFARLHGRDEYDGTGIGLAICQQAVERQGGRIWVESAPGEGARFHITLPFAADDADTGGDRAGAA